MTTATLVPLTEYLHTVYHPDAEWLHGHLLERAVGERSHAFIQTFFIKYFLAREEQWGLQVPQELRSGTTIRVPVSAIFAGLDALKARSAG